MESKELPLDRPATMDKSGHRIYLFPAKVRGWFHNWRSLIQFVLIFIFLGMPFININGRQALLLNVGKREFDIFGLHLRAHNAPLMFFVLASAGFGLFFVTSIWGRIWCGWTCPQTVFIESVFRRIERWIEGNHLEQVALQKAPLTLRKLLLRVCKWSAFVVISLILTHSFLAYFVGRNELLHMIQQKPSENWANFLFILFSSAIILFDFGWFREQFCIIACPYGRFQSVLMDAHSLVVAYDAKRGEPRKRIGESANTGDCVNCYRCVSVCPTGIDIRRGTQMECVACTACIDACDEVMTKLKKPKGLIRYDSANGLLGLPRRTLRFRSIGYLIIVVASISALIFFLNHLNPIEIAILRAKESPYTRVSGPEGEYIVNHFRLELSNQSDQPRQLRLVTSQQDTTCTEGSIVMAQPILNLSAREYLRFDFFVKFPAHCLKKGSAKIPILILENVQPFGDERSHKKEVLVVGPFS